jgi:hypothetical protein
MGNSRRQFWLAVVGLVLAVASTARAQSPGAVLGDDAIAPGAAAYAAGNRAEAVRLLAEAIQRDPHDPRPYYLRALCLAHAGQADEARADLVVAAALESREPHRYSVAATLGQLPVGDHALLNQFRWHAQTEDFAQAFDQGQLTFAERPEPAVRTDAGVLRQQVALPLDRLAQPISLADLTDAAANRPAAVAIETRSNPFADDPAAQKTPANQHVVAEELPPHNSPASEPTATDPSPAQADAAVPTDPFAGADTPTGSDSPTGKIPSGKLLGILQRAVTRAAPLPSLEGVRDQLPSLPGPLAGNQPGAGNPPAAAETPAGSDVEPAAFSEEDPFGQPSPAEEQPPAAEPQEPAAAPEEDPFG